MFSDTNPDIHYVIGAFGWKRPFNTPVAWVSAQFTAFVPGNSLNCPTLHQLNSEKFHPESGALANFVLRRFSVRRRWFWLVVYARFYFEAAIQTTILWPGSVPSSAWPGSVPHSIAICAMNFAHVPYSKSFGPGGNSDS